MKTVVQFERVCKQYHLGLNRTTILKNLSQKVMNRLEPNISESDNKKIFWALRDINFGLDQGQSLALVGRNGAGKSTLLKLMAKITLPTSGRIDIKGRLAALIELGSGFHPDLTGRENIYLNGTILGLKRSEINRRFAEIVAFSEIEPFIDTPVKRYSSGMTVRLGFAVASCVAPDILLVDEVLAVGDASFRQKCIQRIQTLLDNGASIIFVSHNLYMVQAVCSLALYIEHGQIKHSGKTMEVIDMYERDLHEERAGRFQLPQGEQTETVTDIQITKIELLDEEGFATAEFYSQQSLEIRVNYHNNLQTNLANAVIRIVRTDGLTCCMMRTSIDNTALPLQQDQGAFSVTIAPLQLTGGTYFVDARITNAMDNVVLASGWSRRFYVSGLALSHEEESGVFEPMRRWICAPHQQKSESIQC